MKSRKHSIAPVLAGIALLGIVTLCWLSRTRQESPAHPTAALPPPTSGPLRTEAVADFAHWLDTRSITIPADRAPLTPEVLQLARERRTVMESLIRTDPRRALEQAVSLETWRSLPPELHTEVEEPFSAMARYQVLPVCGNPDTGEQASDAMRLISIDGQPQLDTHVFGTRRGITSKEKAPVQGIRLGSLAALHEGTFRELSAAEIPTATSIYPLANPQADRDFATGQPLGDDPLTALAGGKIFRFADRTDFENFADAIDGLDKSPAPQGGSSLVFLPYPADGSGGFNLGEVTRMNNTFASAWTETKKKVFIIRCDFSDKTDALFPTPSAGSYGTLLNTTISDTIRDYSYGKTWIEATVSSSVTRLPQTAAYYAQIVSGGSSRNDLLLTDAKSTYQTANPGFSEASYDIVGIWFTSINMRSGDLEYAGLAGGHDLWIQDNTDPEVHVHEFGHNYGIGHSSFWKPSVGSTNPLDPAGTYEEYGDPFDVMGGGPIAEGVFHSQAKQRLNWLGTGEWTDATAAGNITHRIYRIDDPATAGVRGLRVTKGADEYLWLSYRRLFANNTLKAGANVVWERAGEARSWLIDTTPGSQSGSVDRTDGALTIGRTLSTGNSHITPLARGGSGSAEWLDVRVNTGSFPAGTPVVMIAGPSTIPARQTCVFTALATDPNGDELAYSWDFGQGFTFDNNPSATYSWAVGGTFTVKVTVSDMKGHTAQATKTVTVTDAITTWTDRANSSIGTFFALAANPNKVIAVGENYSNFKGPVASSPDGVTWTDSLMGQNQQVYGATWDGTQFALAGMDYDFAPGVDAFVGCVFTSPTANAGTWSRRIFTGAPLRGIVFGNGVHVAVGDNGTIRRSTDGGVSWTGVPSGTTNRLNSVSYGGGRFVAVGYVYKDTPPTQYNGDVCVLTSPDGLTWTNTSAGAGLESWQDFRSVKWVNDRFLASGFYGSVRTSTNLGVSFSTTRPQREETPAFAYGNGIWFAAGINWDAAEADVDLVSADGVNWTNLTTPALDDRNAAIFFNNTFITAGENHSIRQSGTISQGASGFYTWRESNFPDHGPLSTPDGDQDADGLENLIEYTLGRSPNSGSGPDGPASLPQALISSSDPLLSDRIALQVDLPEPAAGDVVHVVEASSSLDSAWSPLATKTGSGSWTWNAGGTSRIVTSAPSGGRVIVKVGDSVAMSADPHRFLRLRTYVNQ